jgi:MFS family permease
MVGYLVLSPLSDRFGHRRLIIISTVTFALLTLITVLATSVAQLIALRFVTGIALGAAIPSAVSLTTEYSPKRLRATFVLALYCGFSLGFVAAGGVAAWIIPLHGWRSLLWIGAIAPLTLAVSCLSFCPSRSTFWCAQRPNPRASGGWSVASIGLFQTKVRMYSPPWSKKKEVRSAAYFNPTERLERLFFGWCSASTWRSFTHFKVGCRRF